MFLLIYVIILLEIFKWKNYKQILKTPKLLQQYIINKLVSEEPQKFNRENLKRTLINGENIIKSLNISLNNFTENDTKKIVSFLISNNMITPELGKKFNSIFEKIFHANNKVSDIISSVKNLDTNGMIPQDNYYATVFKDVFYHHINFGPVMMIMVQLWHLIGKI